MRRTVTALGTKSGAPTTSGGGIQAERRACSPRLKTPESTAATRNPDASLGLGGAKGITRPSRRRPSVPKGNGFGQSSDTGTAVLFGRRSHSAVVAFLETKKLAKSPSVIVDHG